MLDTAMLDKIWDKCMQKDVNTFAVFVISASTVRAS